MSGALAVTIGPPHSSGPSREEIQLEQARKAGWPRLEFADLRFGRHFIEHVPSGALFFPHRGEVNDALYSTTVGYYMLDGGGIAFLQRPAPGLPQTRDELMQRRAPTPPAPKRRGKRR